MSCGALNPVSEYISHKFRPSHGGADCGQHTAAQILAEISAITRQRRFRPNLRPAHGNTDAAPKILRENNLRAEGKFFFETVTVEQGFMSQIMTEKSF